MINFLTLFICSLGQGNHAPSCYNLAVMYCRGDSGVQKDETLFKKYQKRTNDLIQVYGSVDSKKLA